MKLALSCFVAALGAVQATEELSILTLNFACRDFYPLAACDNCQTRFDLMASAFHNGGDNFEGLPDLDRVDVVIAQELGTTTENFEQIRDAFASRGFIYTTGEPAPRASDSVCNDPLLWNQNAKQSTGGLVGLDHGGLVTWSRFPILKTLKQNWCAHSLPVPAGYLLTLLDVGGGRVAAVFNLHAMPQYNLGVRNSAEGVRTYQFGEASSLAEKLSQAFREAEVPYSVLLGGDFNEDAYYFASQNDSANCGLITNELVKQKFDSVGLDLVGACDTGIIGKPTWDPTSNDLASRKSSDSTHEVLDYLIQHSSSATAVNPVNNVSTFKTKTPWQGQFCQDSSLGEAKPNNVYSSTAFALSDHSIVTASFTLPGTSETSSSAAASLVFDDAIDSWNSGIVDEAACGQEGSVCWTDADCCNADHSWNAKAQHCNGVYCSPCAQLGESCGAQLEGSECCGYHDFASGQGTHCETNSWFTISARCVLKFSKGEICLWDEECQSNSCSWRWNGKRCD